MYKAGRGADVVYSPPEINPQHCHQHHQTPAKTDSFTIQSFQMRSYRQVMPFDMIGSIHTCNV